ncbi:chemotaxis protein CheW [bacterium]|nr:chemotaxis protein CheW [bacterium]
MIERVERESVLLTRVGSRSYALPLAGVVECFRPLSVEAVAGAPPFLLGLSVVRGEPVPVVDLAVLMGNGGVPPGRYVLARLGERRVALAVEEVVGVCKLDADVLRDLPPLLRSADAEAVTAVGVRDDQLLFLLRPARVVPDDLWRTLAPGRGQA